MSDETTKEGAVESTRENPGPWTRERAAAACGRIASDVEGLAMRFSRCGKAYDAITLALMAAKENIAAAGAEIGKLEPKSRIVAEKRTIGVGSVVRVAEERVQAYVEVYGEAARGVLVVTGMSGPRPVLSVRRDDGTTGERLGIFPLSHVAGVE